MKKILTLLLLSFSLLNFAQHQKAEQILEEGKLLFKLEKASWHASDDYLERFPTTLEAVGGYVSYQDSEDEIHTIFFDHLNTHLILVHYHFGKMPEEKPAKVVSELREANDLEKDLIQMFLDTRSKIMENAESFFSFYPNTSFNIVPVVKGRKKQVFVLTAPNESGLLILGNDYLMEYNQRNKLRKKHKIHNSILHFPTTSSEQDKVIQTTYHSHVVTDLISSTDIGTLLLYRDHVEWKQHIVVSEKEVSIFDLDTEKLTIIKTKDWEKMNQ